MGSPREEKTVTMPWHVNTNIIYNDSMYGRNRLIRHLLSKPIPDVDSLINVIRSYNVYFNKDGVQTTPAWRFNVLRELVYFMKPDEKENFFREKGVLKLIQQLALKMHDECGRIKWLVCNREESIELHQMQVACILANAFFCTFPRRRKNQPSINFTRLFEGGPLDSSTLLEKLKCIVHYFTRIHEKDLRGFVTYHRRCTKDYDYPRWDKVDTKLCALNVEAEGCIEDQQDCLQMDFANRIIGGGVLGHGCVQEEIRFAICPELIAARLFTEPLADNEALIIIGAERFCQYEGYADNFRFLGDFRDMTHFDTAQRKDTHILAVDAINFSHPQEQYREGKILREIKKIYSGLVPRKGEKVRPLATGNWGCGAFGGDPELKSLIQVMAASEAGRKVSYFTFGNKKLQEDLLETHNKLCFLKITVGQLYQTLTSYVKKRWRDETVFHFVQNAVEVYVRDKGSLYDTPLKGAEKRSSASATDLTSRRDTQWPLKWLSDKNRLATTANTSGSFQASASVPAENGPSNSYNSNKDSDDFVPCTPEEANKQIDLLKFYGIEPKPRESCSTSTKHNPSSSTSQIPSKGNAVNGERSAADMDMEICDELQPSNFSIFSGNPSMISRFQTKVSDLADLENCADPVYDDVKLPDCDSDIGHNFMLLDAMGEIEEGEIPRYEKIVEKIQCCPNWDAISSASDYHTPPKLSSSRKSDHNSSKESTPLHKRRFSQTTMEMFLKK